MGKQDSSQEGCLTASHRAQSGPARRDLWLELIVPSQAWPPLGGHQNVARYWQITSKTGRCCRIRFSTAGMQAWRPESHIPICHSIPKYDYRHHEHQRYCETSNADDASRLTDGTGRTRMEARRVACFTTVRNKSGTASWLGRGDQAIMSLRLESGSR